MSGQKLFQWELLSLSGAGALAPLSGMRWVVVSIGHYLYLLAAYLFLASLLCPVAVRKLPIMELHTLVLELQP